MLRATSAIRICFMLSVSLATATASAQSYPVRPVRVIVPFTAGTAADAMVRVIGQRLSDSWGQQMVIDNRVGASGIIGTEAAAKSPADGYTLFYGGIAMLAVIPHLYSKLSYDPIKDFEPVSLIASVPHVLVVHPSLPVKSVKELIALAKAHPGQLNYASGGVGSAQHLPMEMLRLAAGINVVHVPYKGWGPAFNDVLGGQVPMIFAIISNVETHRKTGRLRMLAVASPKRLPVLPDVPTIAEAGVPGYSFVPWGGILVPAATPKGVIVKLHADITRTMSMPEVQEKLTALGLDLVGSTPEEFATLIKTDLARFGKLIKEAGIRAE